MNKLVKLVVLVSAFLLSATAAIARPNIVFIMVDDLDVSVWETALKTKDVNTGAYILPNIRSRIIDRGTSFEQMFTSQSLCCPSRATFQTGQYPQNHGVTDNPDDPGEFYDDFKALKEPVALGTWLKEGGHSDGGYRTGFFGKYMNGSGQNAKHVPAGWDVWRALVPKTVIQCMYGYTLANTGGEPETFGTGPLPGSDPRGYQTDKLSDLAVDFIKPQPPAQPDPRPFLLVVTPTAPHTEGCLGNGEKDYSVRTSEKYKDRTPKLLTPPAAVLESYNEANVGDKPKWIQNQHGKTPFSAAELADFTKLFNDKVAALRPIDDMVGSIFQALDDVNKLTNTIVIFTSDNGFQYATHRMVGKDDLYEESIRVPMVVRMPGQTAPRTQQAWVMNNDWAPTIADLAEVAPRMTVDGRSFRALLSSSTATNTRQTLLARSGKNPEKLTGEAGSHHPFLAVRTRNPLLTNDSTGNTVLVYAQTYNADGSLHAQELYDLAVDPDQSESLHRSTDPNRLDQISKLKVRLNKMKNCSGDICKGLEDN